MTDHQNTYGQPIGAPLPDWQGAKPLRHQTLTGRLCEVVPLTTAHTGALHDAFCQDTTGTLWTYMPQGPFDTAAAYAAWVAEACSSADPLFFAIIDKANQRPVGVASYLRITPDMGVAEVGWITFSPSLKRSATATEAMYLMMRNAFDLGYRRYEWKCDALNAASRRAALRLGFTYEGTFRQAVVYKGRNRDTAWFSITDEEWPTIKARLEDWLAPDNFDADGQQRRALGQLA